MTQGDRVALPLEARVLRPPGAGPFPTVIMMHGCGGLQPFLFHYATAFRDAGLAAVVVDSFAHRRISRFSAHLTVCTGLRLRGAERAVDLFAVLDWLSDQSWCAPGRISAAGWSHGGWAIMDAMALASRAPKRLACAQSIEGVVLIYPYCGPPSLTLSRGWGPLRPKVTAILGGRDAVVGARSPKQTLDRLSRDGASVTLHMFADATHAFDDDQASDPRSQFRSDLRDKAISLAIRAVTHAN